VAKLCGTFVKLIKTRTPGIFLQIKFSSVYKTNFLFPRRIWYLQRKPFFPLRLISIASWTPKCWNLKMRNPSTLYTRLNLSILNLYLELLSRWIVCLNEFVLYVWWLWRVICSQWVFNVFPQFEFFVSFIHAVSVIYYNWSVFLLMNLGIWVSVIDHMF
jgi:hypothetical protein